VLLRFCACAAAVWCRTKARLVDSGMMDAAEVKALEKECRKYVDAQAKEAAAGSIPPMNILMDEIYTHDATAREPLMLPFSRSSNVPSISEWRWHFCGCARVC
jgi:hypothetical protein